MSSSNLFWIDIETTSLDYKDAKILEVFVLVTDKNLNALDSIELVIHYSEEELLALRLSNWVTHQHATLLELAKASTLSLQTAESKLAEFFEKHCRGKKAILAGSSVYFDRNVLAEQMPGVMPYVHYRVVDVSSFMEIARRWLPQLHNYAPARNHTHRAREDVYSSLNLMAFYRHTMVQPPWITYPSSSRPPTIHSVYL